MFNLLARFYTRMATLLVNRLVLNTPAQNVHCALTVTLHHQLTTTTTTTTSTTTTTTSPPDNNSSIDNNSSNDETPRGVLASLTTDHVSQPNVSNTGYVFQLNSLTLPSSVPPSSLLLINITVYHGQQAPAIYATGSFPITSSSFYSLSASVSLLSSTSNHQPCGHISLLLTSGSGSPPTEVHATETPPKNDITFTARDKEKDSIISRLMSELDRRTDAIKRLGEDIVKIRHEKAALETSIRDLKRQETQRELFARQVAGLDVRGLTRDEVVQQYTVVSKNYQLEAARNQDLQKRIAQVQESLMKKNDAEKKLLEIQQAHTAQLAYIQKLQDQAAKVSKYKAIIVKQEGIIRKLERYQDRPPVIIPSLSPPKQLDEVLPQTSKSQEPVVMYDTALLMRAEAAEARVAALEQELETACREFAIALANADVQ